jgi:hypothetical protein
VTVVRWPITVYCADTGHLRQGETVPRRVTVAGATYVNGRWWPTPHGSASGRKPSPLERGALAGIDEDRWRFECSLCRMTVPARDEKVQWAFERLAEIGEPEASLRLLATMLAKQ